MDRSCKGCSQVLPLEAFAWNNKKDGSRKPRCLPCHNKYRREQVAASPETRARLSTANAAWRTANPDKVRANNQKWYSANRERARELHQQWMERNPEHYRELRRVRWNRWKERNKDAVLTQGREAMRRPERRVSRLIWGCLKGRKSGVRWCELVGYSEQELRDHLERQFLRGMSFSNYGEWHIDHIIPLASFVIESADDPQFKRAWALSNLRPLWAADNIRKGDKVLTLL